MSDVFYPGWKPEPLWWEDAPLRPADDPLPPRADVAIVGSGYAGLTAALTLARAGSDVVVIDAGDPGCGASSRNHGMISGGQKLPTDLARRVGAETAQRIEDDARSSYEFMENLIRQEALDVDYARDGRMIVAHTPAAFASLSSRAETLRTRFGYQVRTLGRDSLRTEIGSDFYAGAMVVEDAGGLHPAKLHRALRERATGSGVKLFGKSAVLSSARSGSGFRVRTLRGDLQVDKLVFATNAYSDPAAKFLRRRLIPVTAYMAATEELDPEVARACIPHNRMVVDTKRALYAMRLSPDRKRIVFAGRAKFGDIDEREATPILHGFMTRVFPQLRATRITHSWKGIVAFTFDHLPHIAENGGIHFVGGCQGNGVAMMPYLGHRLALKLLGRDNRRSGFDRDVFPTMPLYTGKPWFLPALGAYYRMRDAVERSLSRM